MTLVTLGQYPHHKCERSYDITTSERQDVNGFSQITAVKLSSTPEGRLLDDYHEFKFTQVGVVLTTDGEEYSHTWTQLLVSDGVIGWIRTRYLREV